MWAGKPEYENSRISESAFWVTEDGRVKLDDTVGSVIGGWNVEQGRLYYKTINGEEYFISTYAEVKRKVGEVEKEDWKLLFGDNFGVDSNGTLYANNPKIFGSISGITISDSTIEGYCTTEQYNKLVERVKALEDATT